MSVQTFYTLDVHYNRVEWSDQAQAEVGLVQKHLGAGTVEVLGSFWFRADPLDLEDHQDKPAPAHLQPGILPGAYVTDDPKPYARWRFDRLETPALSTACAIRLLCRTGDVIGDVKPDRGNIDDLAAFLAALEAQGIARAEPAELWGAERVALLAGLGNSWGRAALAAEPTS